MKTSLFAVAVSAASLVSAIAQVEICTCTGDCKARGDPHVERFDGINFRLEQVSDVDTWNMLYEVANAQVEIFISEQNKGIYATEVKIHDLATGEETHERSNEYCQLGGNNEPIRATVIVTDNTPPVSEQSVAVEVRCAKPKDTGNRCPNGSRDLCDWHFDTFVTKSSEVQIELGGDPGPGEFDFQRIEDLVNSDGFCLPPDEWNTDRPTNRCRCVTVDDPPFFEPTPAPVTWAPTTPSPTTAAPTTQIPTLAPTPAPTSLAPTRAPTTQASTLAPTTIAPTMPPTGNLTCRVPAAVGSYTTSCFSGGTVGIISPLPNNLTLYQMDDRFLVVGELEPNTTGVHVKTLSIQYNGKWITRIDSNDWCKPYSLRGLQDANSTSVHAQYVWPESQEYVMVDVSCTSSSNPNPYMMVVINKKSSSPQAIQNPNQWEQDQGYSGTCVC